MKLGFELIINGRPRSTFEIDEGCLPAVNSFSYRVEQVIHPPIPMLRMPRSASSACVMTTLSWSEREFTNAMTRLLTRRKSVRVRQSSCRRISRSSSGGRASRTPIFVLEGRRRHLLSGGDLGDGSLSSRMQSLNPRRGRVRRRSRGSQISFFPLGYSGSFQEGPSR